jgi:hypothetical protein
VPVGCEAYITRMVAAGCRWNITLPPRARPDKPHHPFNPQALASSETLLEMQLPCHRLSCHGTILRLIAKLRHNFLVQDLQQKKSPSLLYGDDLPALPCENACSTTNGLHMRVRSHRCSDAVMMKKSIDKPCIRMLLMLVEAIDLDKDCHTCPTVGANCHSL